MKVQLMVSAILGRLPMALSGITHNSVMNKGEVRPKLDIVLT
jgi:hypothetical protein